jgi:flagellar motor protein MotB
MFEREQDSNAGNVTLWAAFGDLMACLFGVFVLFFVWLVAVQVSLAEDLRAEKSRSEQAMNRLATLERALAGPIQSGLITLTDGRIGIRASVLFALNSADLTGEGQALLRQITAPLATYLEQQNQSAMISGFTDDIPIHGHHRTYSDNWELSAQRALTVVRALVAAGIPRHRVFAASFGENHPAVPNTSEENRAQNRRVEIAPVPQPELARWQ